MKSQVRKCRAESKLESLNEAQYLLGKQEQEIRKLQERNEGLTAKFKKAGDPKPELAKRLRLLEKKLDAAQGEHKKVKAEKVALEDTNRQVMRQLSAMKELVTDTKEREGMNKELLIKVKAKQEKLAESMAREKAHRDRIRTLETQLKEIEGRVQRDTDDDSGRYLE